MKKTAIITGAAGLLGSHLSRHLLGAGWRVAGLDNLSGGYREWLPLEHADFSFFELDLADGDRVMEVFEAVQPTVVFHFAAYAAEGLSPFIRTFNYTNNLVASAAVINGCIQVEAKLVFTSSMAVYGRQRPPFIESMPRIPIDPYGIAKAAVEADIEVAAEQHHLRYSIVRPHNVVGIRQNIWDNYRNVLGIFIRRAISGEPLLLFGGGDQLRAFSHVTDYMRPFELLVERGDSQIFNLGADHPTPIKDLAREVAGAAGRRGLEVRIEEVQSRHEVFAAYCDHQKAISELGFVDRTDLRTIIEEMFDWALSEPERPLQTMAYELEKGIYDFWLS